MIPKVENNRVTRVETRSREVIFRHQFHARTRAKVLLNFMVNSRYIHLREAISRCMNFGRKQASIVCELGFCD